jgi:fatty-acyl-CoA synthase
MTRVVSDWVARNARLRPGAPALAKVETGETRTWGELEPRVAALAWLLRDRYKVGRGDRVSLICENDIRLFELQFACMRLGAILVPLNFRLAVPELLRQLTDAEPTVVVHDHAWAHVGRELAMKSGIGRRLQWGGEAGADDAGDYEELLAAASDGVPADGQRDADEITHILYTSGTTGRPKGALSSQGTLMWHAINMAHTLGMAESGCHHLNIVPLFHAGGLNVFTNPILYWGGRVTTVERFDALTALRLLADPERAVTHACGIPQMWEGMAALEEFETVTFPALRHALVGGSGANPQEVIAQLWRARGVLMATSWGATENGPLATILPAEDTASVDRRSCGFTVPYTRLRLVGEDGADVAADAVGEIWLSGPAITRGYWRQPRAESFTGDWFRTRDLARRDEAGHHYIVGRLTDVFRTGGENVYPAEVETVLAAMPQVSEVVVMGIPDERWGQTGIAVIRPEDGQTVTLEAVQAFADGKLARYKIPKSLLLVEEMPRNVTAKVSRQRLRDLVDASLIARSDVGRRVERT